MTPQDLIHVISFQEQVVTQSGGQGEQTVAWQDVRTGVPAQVLTGPSKESILAGAKHSDVALRVNFWWFDGLDTSWRVVYKGESYDVVSAITDATGMREWRLECQKIGDGT